VTAGLPAALPSDLPGALAPTLGPHWPAGATRTAAASLREQ